MTKANSSEQLMIVDAELAHLHGRMAELYSQHSELVQNIGQTGLTAAEVTKPAEIAESPETPEAWGPWAWADAGYGGVSARFYPAVEVV